MRTRFTFLSAVMILAIGAGSVAAQQRAREHVRPVPDTGMVGIGGSVGIAPPREASFTNGPALTFNGARGAVSVGEDGAFFGDPVLLSDSREVSDGGLVFATNNTDPVSVLRPTIVAYSCPITLGSDVRTIRFVLDSVTMLAPPGRTFP